MNYKILWLVEKVDRNDIMNRDFCGIYSTADLASEKADEETDKNKDPKYVFRYSWVELDK